ncbi:Non-histone protein 10 [Naviculisporaceae sp. PSN 640]
MAPASSIPPALPPSVEEAYRRKCIQLKQRTAEVEEANDAARLRLSRLKRQVEKMRLERAFLLEQLAKRTSTNVEDSDGSPSPPPTPKEKPLRIKRGHRKPSMLANIESGTPSAAGGATFISQNNLRTQSPSSDTFSTQHHQDGRLNGVHGAAPRKPGNAFELYCDETREALKAKNQAKDQDQDGDVNMNEELAQGWEDLPESQKQEFQAREEHELTRYREEKEAYEQKKKENEEAAAAAAAESEAARRAESDDAAGIGGGDDRTSQQPHQEDVEMGNYDSDQETQGEKPEE